MKARFARDVAALSATLALLGACGGGGDDDALPQLSAATGATLTSCADLTTRLSFANTVMTSASAVAAGTLTVAGSSIPAHCLVTGKMNQRTSAVDGQSYAIGFEMRLPNAWNGRFFYQANGGIDGNVVTATGPAGNFALTNALNMGFAVISSDAGHTGAQSLGFGVDPQARLDYGYQAVAALTPMAKAAIKTAYGKAPDRSYFGGCSNGGRHTMVAAARYADQYDGFLVGDPGFNLPKASVANMAGAQAYLTLATSTADLSTGFTTTERTLVTDAVLAKCDALDGVADKSINDTKACQAAFSLDRDVPTCTGARDGTCLSAAQKSVIGRLFTGATTSTGTVFYTSFPFDSGINAPGWASWKFSSSLFLDPLSVILFSVPPADPATFNGRNVALNSSIDALVASISTTNATYTESSLSFMTPPHPTDLSVLKGRGAKLMVYHGTSDPIFSSDDTTHWYDGLRAANGGDASTFARFYPIPGMNHCSGGPATDQFDMLTPLVAWVEQGQAPDSVSATARGTGNVVGVNADLPTTWSASRTRPLCPYPKVARYKGTGDIESSTNFTCQ